MGFLDRLVQPKVYEGPTYPEYGVPFGAVKAGLGEHHIGGRVCWPLRVLQIRHERGEPVRGVPLTQYLDCQYEGYDVWREPRAPFDWVDDTDSALGHYYVDVTLDPYRQDEQLCPIADDLIEANNSGHYPGASHIVVVGTLAGVDDRSRWAGAGAKMAPFLAADAIHWEWWPGTARDYVETNPNFSAYPASFNPALFDPQRGYDLAAKALEDDWWAQARS